VVADSRSFVPQGTLPLVSPIFEQAAWWPDFADGLDQPAPGDPRFPGDAALGDLEYLVTTWLHPDIVPRRLRPSMGLCGHGRLTIRVGRTSAEWAELAHSRAEARRLSGAPEPVRIEGFASAQRHEAFPTFVVALEWAEPQPPVTMDSLMARLARVVPPALYEELGAGPSSPREHPTVHGPDGYAATAMLDMAGHGNIFPYLYLYADRFTLLSIFQQVPHRMA
jgi:hypothetical protein